MITLRAKLISNAFLWPVVGFLVVVGIVAEKALELLSHSSIIAIIIVLVVF